MAHVSEDNDLSTACILAYQLLEAHCEFAKINHPLKY